MIIAKIHHLFGTWKCQMCGLKNWGGERCIKCGAHKPR